jgi:phthiocerol/phenolphthiocerol synthesis type-I polyketide synthase E
MSRGNGTRGEARFEPIAIVGMRGRFPGARDLDEFWDNLAGGVESIAVLTPEDLRDAGIPDDVAQLPGYVNASPTLDAVDEFDAEFFGFSARDAALTDPQHRLFLETAWEALEDAGYDPATHPGSIGVFGGCELSSYLYQLFQSKDQLGYLDGMQLMVTNDKDHLCTQVSYRLDLRGPSVVVQTTCSTSLVAVALACESLHSGRCDLALAGGVTVRVPQRGGYFYTPGSILSPDGHCRPFDADAQGTIVGSGVGVVALRRLEDALGDGDNVRAVILGAGLNNDGSDKAGYTAPSFRGQTAAIRSAHAMSGVSAETIGYVEAHGTGTILGDPIELSALSEAFKVHTDQRGFCGIGSLKSNVGHLSCAAGVAGLIKTVLVLEHGAIPPTVHYSAPNPAIDFAGGPFYVTTSLHPWSRNGTPRRAGVSSFGVGGTNAHVVVEEAPAGRASDTRRPHQLLVLSGRTEDAAQATATRLAAHLERHPELDLADVAFTLQRGRRAFRMRRFAVAATGEREQAVAVLRDGGRGAAEAGAAPEVVFMFPGQGAQYPGMAAGLYKSEPVVRRTIDHCAEVLTPLLDGDIRRLLFPAARRKREAAERLRDTRWAQPALFAVEYAVSQLLRSWRIEPAAMVGHSVGEFVAATLAGVMTLDDALSLIAHRGQLISALPRGSMLAVMAPVDLLEPFVNGEVSLAAVNAPNLSVLSGPDTTIEQVEAALTGWDIPTRRLHTSHAFHSAMMEPILGEFEQLVTDIALSSPEIPFVSTVTAEWVDGAMREPAYWSGQLRRPVRFADALDAVLAPDGPAGTNPALVEVGPGGTLVTFAAETARALQRAPRCLSSLPTPSEGRADTEVILETVGQLWASGVEVDWGSLHAGERRRRASLPTYPFERRSYWVGTPPGGHARQPLRETSDWFHRPVWREKALPATASFDGARILVFDEGAGLGASVAERVRALGGEPVLVARGGEFRGSDGDSFVIDPGDPRACQTLAAEACTRERPLAGVIDCWSAGASSGGSASARGGSDLEDAALIALLTPMRVVAALSDRPTVRPLPMVLVARGARHVNPGDTVDPLRAFGIGVAKVVPQEHPGFRLAHIDVDDDESVAGHLVAELSAGAPESAVALRSGRRLIEEYEPVVLDSTDPPAGLPEHPVVLVTGGMGHIGFNLAEALFDHLGARLILTSRSPLPDPSEWARLSGDMSVPAAQRERMRRLARMRDERDEVVVLAGDLGDPAQVSAVVDEALARFDRIDVVVHGAGRIDPAAFAPAADTTRDVVAAQLTPKLTGLVSLLEAFQGREPLRWILHGSISAVLGGLGLAAYAGVNAVLDAFAMAGGEGWLSIGWDAWDNAGEAASVGLPDPIRAAEGVDAIRRLLAADVGPVALVVAGDLEGRLDAWVRRAEAGAGEGDATERHPRPSLSTPFEAPRTETEAAIAEIWGAQLGIEEVGVHDRFLDLGGHSLLAVQVASEVRDAFDIELPVLKLFEAPTVGQLAAVVDSIRSGTAPPDAAGLPDVTRVDEAVTVLEGDGPATAAKAGYRAFYDDVTRRLERSGAGDASFFLNYGYISLAADDEAIVAVPEDSFNASSVRLVHELIGATDLRDRRVLDIGCGRGGTVAALADEHGAEATGLDLSPEAISFCRRAHRDPRVRFEVGDAEHLPFEDESFEAATNIESSHTYPNLRAFLAEVRRVLVSGGMFLYTDLLPVQRWAEIRLLLGSLDFAAVQDRDITANVVASCDAVAASRVDVFGEKSAAIENFLAVPGSAVYEQMRSGAWEYRILRSERQ